MALVSSAAKVIRPAASQNGVMPSSATSITKNVLPQISPSTATIPQLFAVISTDGCNFNSFVKGGDGCRAQAGRRRGCCVIGTWGIEWNIYVSHPQVCHLMGCYLTVWHLLVRHAPAVVKCRGVRGFNSFLCRPFFQPKSTASCRAVSRRWLRSGGHH